MVQTILEKVLHKGKAKDLVMQVSLMVEEMMVEKEAEVLVVVIPPSVFLSLYPP